MVYSLLLCLVELFLCNATAMHIVLIIAVFLLLSLGDEQQVAGAILRRRAGDENGIHVPDDPEAEGYFNYIPGSKYGPSSWGSLETKKLKERKYWKKYKKWLDVDLNENMCGSGSARQSPIDLSFGAVNAECLEYHEIKDRGGRYDLDDEYFVDFEIQDTKLRMKYAFDYDKHEAWNWGGPNADIPKGWGGQLPVLHIDFKVPSEHTMNGKRFAAEYQIHLLQNLPAKRGAPVVSVLLDLHPEDKANNALQIVLDEFQAIWDKDKKKCKKQRRRTKRELGDQKRLGGARREQKRELRHGIRWNCFDKELMPSVWFYGYEGSLTEPPCSEFVEYRIIDAPAYISQGQLDQMKELIFDHVDPKRKCRKAGAVVNHNDSVARPIQPTLDRMIHKCYCRDFISDADRIWYGNNRCWEGDESIFHERATDVNRIRVDSDSVLVEVEGSEVDWITNSDTRPDMNADGVWNCYNDEFLTPPCCGSDSHPAYSCGSPSPSPSL